MDNEQAATAEQGQTAEAQVAAANTADAQTDPLAVEKALEAQHEAELAAKNAAPEVKVEEPAPVVVEPVKVHEDFIEAFVSHLLKELKSGEEYIGQYFQMIFKKHPDGSHTMTVQPTGRAGDVAGFVVTTPTAE